MVSFSPGAHAESLRHPESRKGEVPVASSNKGLPLGIVAAMRIRALIESSKTVRVLCFALLVLFVLVCGVHVAGAHHDADLDGLGLGNVIAILAMAYALLLILIQAARSPRLVGLRSSSQYRFRPRRAFDSDRLTSRVMPLLC
jgi:hypothetical protein